MSSAFSKSSVFVCPHVHAINSVFQKVLLWRAFSKGSVFIDRYHGIRVDGSCIRKEEYAFSNENGYVHVDRALVQLLFPALHAPRFHEMQICLNKTD